MTSPDRIPLADVAEQWGVTQFEIVEAAHELGYSTIDGLHRSEVEPIRLEVVRRMRGGRHRWRTGDGE